VKEFSGLGTQIYHTSKNVAHPIHEFLYPGIIWHSTFYDRFPSLERLICIATDHSEISKQALALGNVAFDIPVEGQRSGDLMNEMTAAFKKARG